MSKVEKDKLKPNSIPPYIVEAISSLPTDRIFRSESCPACPFETFDIQEKLDENLKKREKVKETEYKIGNYLIKKTLGQGTFGKVKLGIYLPTQEKVAIKILEKDRIIEKDDEIRVKREFDMLALFNHPNVILVAEIFESSDSYYSVMEYCEGGELFNYIVKNRRLSEEESAFFYYQLINGLEYIHSLGIVHRDLKPENLLLTNEHLLKIIDFGLSNYFKEGQKDLLATPCGSPCYASPEMVGGKKYNGFKIDIWSSGIILYAMLCGYLPFEDKDNDILFEKILECKLVFPKYVKKLSRDLMERILVTDPDQRISISEIKKHPFYLKGKELFEQEFSVYQIIKDANEKTSFVENIDLNHILENQKVNDNNKPKKKIENNENKENKDNKENIDINGENINKSIKNENKNSEEKRDIDKQEERKEIEIKINENENEKNDKEIKKDEKKDEIVKDKDNKEKENNISDKNINQNIMSYELEQENIDLEIKKDNDEKSYNSLHANFESERKENKDNISKTDNIEIKEDKDNLENKENKNKSKDNIEIKEDKEIIEINKENKDNKEIMKEEKQNIEITKNNKENIDNLENIDKKENLENKENKENNYNEVILIDSGTQNKQEDNKSNNNINNINSKNNSKNNSKKILNSNNAKSINTTNKKTDLLKNNKIVTLIKNKDNESNIRRKLIKNKHKLNIRERTKSRVYKSSRKQNKIVNSNNLRRPFITQKKVDISPNLKNMKFESKKLVNKGTNNSKIFQKKFSSKGNIQKNKYYNKGVTPNNNINNTIDDEELPKKLKIHFNFQKLNIASAKSSKRANSVAKHNIKLTSFETSKIKKEIKNVSNLYEINPSVKKNNKNLSNNMRQNNVNGVKYNLLHKKNIKEIKINLKNGKKSNTIEDDKKNILKTEINKEKGKHLLEIKGFKKMKLPNLNTDNINNANIKIVENTNDTKEDTDVNYEKINLKNYNIKTNKKKVMNNKKYETSLKNKNDYIMRTFDKEKNDRFMKNNFNKYSKISGNLNMNLLKNIEHRNTIDVDDNKNHRINIDISTNIGCRKINNTTSYNNTIEKNNSKIKTNKAIKKKEIVNKIDILEKDNINIDIDSNNKNIIHRDKDTNNNNINLLENVLKTEKVKKEIIPDRKNLITIEQYNSKENKNPILNMKITPIIHNRNTNYRKNAKNNKKQNIPKNLNKTSNSSNFNSFIKNPFIPTDSNNFNTTTINQSTNNSNFAQSTNYLGKKSNTNNKNSQKLINNNKKKPCVTIRNTVINFNMIDSGLILASLNRKKDTKKRTTTIGQNNSVNKLQNNHLYGLCSKFNNNLMPNINNSNIHGDVSIKTKTINVNSNNNLQFNGKKMENYMKNIKKISNINNKKYLNNHDKMHMKYNSMRLEDFYGLKKKKKTLNDINTHKIGNITNNSKLISIDQKHYNTISNEEIGRTKENNKKFIIKNK